jgi:hypothetical protein
MTTTAAPDLTQLRVRIAELRHTVSALEDKLAALPDLARGLPDPSEVARLAERLTPVLLKQLDDVRANILALEAKRGPPPALWDDFEALVRQADGVAEDVVLFVEGALARAARLDGGLCAIVDRLLADIGRWTVAWDRTAIPMVREQVSSRTWMIGVRISDASIWPVPLAAHELGHFAADDLKDAHNQRLVSNLLAGAWLDSVEANERDAAERFLHGANALELFADVFAAWVIGPAYAAALTWRSAPHRPWDSQVDHPPWGVRIRAVHTTLERVGGWDGTVEQIAEDWAHNVEAAGAKIDAPSALARFSDAFVLDALGVLAATSSRARFTDHESVLDAEERLGNGAAPPANADLRVIVNAAWSWRVRAGWGVDAAPIAERALRWCRELATEDPPSMP